MNFADVKNYYSELNYEGSSIYIHIPFCKQACYYCDFHFSTSLKKKNDMVDAIIQEIELRKNELNQDIIANIYFGGGTPSILSNDEIERIIQAVYNNHNVSDNPEITLEANPDDLNEERIKSLWETKINRLSIGVQSFFEDDLKLMNRAHNSLEAIKCIEIASLYFENISIDLIYGIPNMSNEKWQKNIDLALAFNTKHISSYALTVEPKTALASFIEKKIIDGPKDEIAQEHFQILIEKLEANEFIHYETSNFGKKGYFSKNNTAYWLGNKYIGIGPSAHSYDGKQRSWNVRNNSTYIQLIQKKELPIERELLTKIDQYNEYIMTSLRTIWGISISKIETEFGSNYKDHLLLQSQKYLNEGLLSLENNILSATIEGKFFTDGIASDLFLLNLE